MIEKGSAEPRVPGRVQVVRVLVLARLLTIVTGIVSALVVLAVRWAEREIGRDLSLDGVLLNWRVWPAVFGLWLVVFTVSRSYLRLDTRP